MRPPAIQRRIESVEDSVTEKHRQVSVISDYYGHYTTLTILTRVNSQRCEMPEPMMHPANSATVLRRETSAGLRRTGRGEGLSEEVGDSVST